MRARVFVLVAGWQDQQQSFANRSGFLTIGTIEKRGVQGTKLRFLIRLWRVGARTHPWRLGAKGSWIKGKTCHGSILLRGPARVKVKMFLCGVSSPRDESLLFRQKEPKPWLPVRGSSEPAQKPALRDASASVPNKMAKELALLKQPSPRSRFGTEAPPRTKARRDLKKPNQSPGQESIGARNPNRLGLSPKNEPHTGWCGARQ